MDDWGGLLVGLMLIVFGITIWIDPVHYSDKHRMVMDFTDIQHPFAIFLVLWGLGFLWTVFRKK